MKERTIYCRICDRYGVNPETGRPCGPRGELTPRLGRDGYLRFNVRVDGKHRAIRVHRYHAWLLFGDEVFGHGVVVRHLDNDKCNNSATNLKLGDARQNYYDRFEADREASAEQAASVSRRLTRDAVREIRRLCALDDGPSKSELAREHGVSPSTIGDIVARRTYRDV